MRGAGAPCAQTRRARVRVHPVLCTRKPRACASLTHMHTREQTRAAQGHTGSLLRGIPGSGCPGRLLAGLLLLQPGVLESFPTWPSADLSSGFFYSGLSESAAPSPTCKCGAQRKPLRPGVDPSIWRPDGQAGPEWGGAEAEAGLLTLELGQEQ